jgi:hypothetical protein
VVILPAVGILSSLESPGWILEAPGLDHVRKMETRMKVTDIGKNGQHSVVGNGLSPRNLLDRTTRGGYQLKTVSIMPFYWHAITYFVLPSRR